MVLRVYFGRNYFSLFVNANVPDILFAILSTIAVRSLAVASRSREQ